MPCLVIFAVTIFALQAVSLPAFSDRSVASFDSNRAKQSVPEASFPQAPSNGQDSGLLQWHEGTPYPIVDGRQIVPPMAPTSSKCPSGGCHWYYGAVFNNSSVTATELSTSILIPSGSPRTPDLYYVLLSAWDNNGSYDQIGFSDNYGKNWGVSYSYTNDGYCSNPSYGFNIDAFNLTQGTLYTFTMDISGGVVVYDVSIGSRVVWTESWNAFNNTAQDFVLSKAYCGSEDYTVYEEAYMTKSTTEVPRYDFEFIRNVYDVTGTGGASGVHARWQTWYTATSPASIFGVIPSKYYWNFRIVNV